MKRVEMPLTVANLAPAGAKLAPAGAEMTAAVLAYGTAAKANDGSS